MDNWDHFLNCNVEINIEQTGNFPSKYAEGVFNIESGSIYIEIEGYHHFNKDDSNIYYGLVEIKEQNIQKLFELELFEGTSFENFGIVKNETFNQLNDFLEKIQLQKNLEKELLQPTNKNSIKTKKV